MTKPWKKFVQEQNAKPITNISDNPVLRGQITASKPTATLASTPKKWVVDTVIDSISNVIPQSTKNMAKYGIDSIRSGTSFLVKEVWNAGKAVSEFLSPVAGNKDLMDNIKTQAENDEVITENHKWLSNTATLLAKNIISEAGAKLLPEYFEDKDGRGFVFNGNRLEEKPVVRKLWTEASFSQLYDTIGYKMSVEGTVLDNNSIREMFPEYKNIPDEEFDLFKSSVAKDVQSWNKRDINELAEYYPKLSKYDGYVNKLSSTLKFIDFYNTVDKMWKLSELDMADNPKDDSETRSKKTNDRLLMKQYRDNAKYLIDAYKQAKDIAVWDWSVDIYDVLDNIRGKHKEVDKAMSFIEKNPLSDDFIINMAARIKNVADNSHSAKYNERKLVREYENTAWEASRKRFEKNGLIGERALIRWANNVLWTDIAEPELGTDAFNLVSKTAQSMSAWLADWAYGVEKIAYWYDQLDHAKTVGEGAEAIANMAAGALWVVSAGISLTPSGIAVQWGLASDNPVSNKIKEILGKAQEITSDTMINVFNAIREAEWREKLDWLDLWHMGTVGEQVTDFALERVSNTVVNKAVNSKTIQANIKRANIIEKTIWDTMKQGYDYIKNRMEAKSAIKESLSSDIDAPKNGVDSTKVDTDTGKVSGGESTWLKHIVQLGLDEVKDFVRDLNTNFHLNLFDNLITAKMADWVPFETALIAASEQVKGFIRWTDWTAIKDSAVGKGIAEGIDWAKNMSFESATKLSSTLDMIRGEYYKYRKVAMDKWRKVRPYPEEMKVDKATDINDPKFESKKKKSLEKVRKEVEMTDEVANTIATSPYTQKMLEIIDQLTNEKRNKKGKITEVTKDKRITVAEIQNKFIEDHMKSLREVYLQLWEFKNKIGKLYNSLPKEANIDAKTLIEDFIAPRLKELYNLDIDLEKGTVSISKSKNVDGVDDAVINVVKKLLSSVEKRVDGWELSLDQLWLLRRSVSDMAYNEAGIKNSNQARVAEEIRQQINNYLDSKLWEYSPLRLIDKKYEQIMDTLDLFDWFFSDDMAIKNRARTMLMNMDIEDIELYNEFIPWLKEAIAVTKNAAEIVKMGIDLKTKKDWNIWNKGAIYSLSWGASMAIAWALWTTGAWTFLVWGFLSPFIHKFLGRFKKFNPDLWTFNNFVKSMEISNSQKQQLIDRVKEGAEKRHADAKDIESYIDRVNKAFDSAIEKDAIHKIESRWEVVSDTNLRREKTTISKGMENAIAEDIKNSDIDYENVSTDGLKAIADNPNIPDTDLSSINKILSERWEPTVTKSATSALDEKYAGKIRELNESEPTLEKMDENVSMEDMSKKRSEWEDKKEALIDEMLEDYKEYTNDKEKYSFIDKKWAELESKNPDSSKTSNVMYPEEEILIKELSDERDKGGDNLDTKTAETDTKQTGVSDDKTTKVYQWNDWEISYSEWKTMKLWNGYYFWWEKQAKNFWSNITEIDISKYKFYEAKDTQQYQIEAAKNGGKEEYNKSLKEQGYDGIKAMNTAFREFEYLLFDNPTKAGTNQSTDIKQKQFEGIQKHNPMKDDYHTGIRNVEDIKTWEEAMKDKESFVYWDFTIEDAQKALEKGKITVYSSKPIEQWWFVSTSKKMATDYAWWNEKNVYSQEVDIDDVAWINWDEWQFVGK